MFLNVLQILHPTDDVTYFLTKVYSILQLHTFCYNVIALLYRYNKTYILKSNYKYSKEKTATVNALMLIKTSCLSASRLTSSNVVWIILKVLDPDELSKVAFPFRISYMKRILELFSNT